MNDKAKSILKNINYTVSANFFVLIISFVLNLIIPKFLGITEYSYWQLYVFYTSFAGFFHLGWIDGVYLKIAGEDYNNLDKKVYGSQFVYFLGLQIFLAVSIIIFSRLFLFDNNTRSTMVLLTAIVLVITNCRSYILSLLQSTNRIKESAILSRNDRYIYMVLSLSYLFLGGRRYILLIVFDVISKLIMVFWGCFKIADMWKTRLLKLNLIVPEIIENIKIGSNLMISNIANQLILGTSRMFIEQHWSIEIFGKLSLTLNLSNMFMVFINAIGVVFFPLLRRTNENKLSKLYINLREVFITIAFGLMLFFYPTKIILILWLPNYAESLVFMGILFPMVIYEGKMVLLTITYLKTIRAEKSILLANVSALIVSLIGSFISIFIVHNLTMSVISILGALIFRSIFAEFLLERKLKINIVKKNSIELLLVSIFIVSNLVASTKFSFLLYLVSYILFIVIRFKSAKQSFVELLSLAK